MSRLSPDDLVTAYPDVDFLVAEGTVSSDYMVVAHKAFYEFAARHCQGLVLDAGCGTGFGTRLLARSSSLAVGIDSKHLLIRYGRQNYQASTLALMVMDATRMAFARGSFDVVVADELVEHLPQHSPFLEETARVLKDDGLFLCATVNRAHSFGTGEKPLNRNHFREYDAADFRAELGRYFHRVEVLGQGIGADFEKYMKNRPARGIEWLLVKTNVKHRIPPIWRSRVRSWISGVPIHSSLSEEFKVTEQDVAESFYLVALARRPRRPSPASPQGASCQ